MQSVALLLLKGPIPWCLLCLCLNSELLGSASRPIVLLLEQINPTLVNEFCIAIASVATYVRFVQVYILN